MLAGGEGPSSGLRNSHIGKEENSIEHPRNKRLSRKRQSSNVRHTFLRTVFKDPRVRDRVGRYELGWAKMFRDRQAEGCETVFGKRVVRMRVLWNNEDEDMGIGRTES